ncbi:MAG: lamin tail domain-containing protein, partial [Trueperaceae bacterium]
MRSIIAAAALLTLNIAGAQVIISEYVEGSGNNKALEFHNAGSDAVVLATCVVEMYFNGKEHADLRIRLVGLLEPGAVHVLFHEEGDELRDHWATGAWQGGGFGWFNGNDVIVLRCGGEVADSMGQVGDDTQWGKDKTLRRLQMVADADPHDEWEV